MATIRMCDRCGPIWTHELADRTMMGEIKERAKPDFLALCNGGGLGE